VEEIQEDNSLDVTEEIVEDSIEDEALKVIENRILQDHAMELVKKDFIKDKRGSSHMYESRTLMEKKPVAENKLESASPKEKKGIMARFLKGMR
jgi:hypothetical protein